MTVRRSIERRRSLVVLMEGGDLRRRDVGLPTWNICETGGTRLRGVRSELLGVALGGSDEAPLKCLIMVNETPARSNGG